MIIVVGIRNTTLSEKMQLQPELTLKKAIMQARESEAIKLQQPLLRGGSETKFDTPVGTVNVGKSCRKSKSRQNTGTTPYSQSGGSTRCGKYPAHDRLHCPAKDVTCRKCGKQGHYQSVCQYAGVSGVDSQDCLSDSATGYDSFLGIVEASPNGKSWAVTVEVNGTLVELHIDTGAEVTVVSEQVWKEIGQPTLS